MYWNITDKERLAESFKLASEDTKLFEEFLSEILTKKEIEQLMKRLKAMCLLHDIASYSQIIKTTSLSSATIARLSKIVADRESGFRKIIKKFEKSGQAYFE